jgi:hypothetical protein
MATLGSPAKYTYALAEREDANPWGPLHASLGFDAGESVVTVFGGEGPHNVNDHVSQRAANLLAIVAGTAATLGSNLGWYFARSQLLVILGPEHAATIAADGWSRADIQRFLYEHARLPLSRRKLGGMWGNHDWPHWMATADDRTLLPVVPGPEDILVMVAGGPGKHSAVVPNCCFSRAVSRPVTGWPGQGRGAWQGVVLGRPSPARPSAPLAPEGPHVLGAVSRQLTVE